MKKKGTVIFDLDDTLFNTSKLKSDIFLLLAESGISLEIIRDSYREIRNQETMYQTNVHVSFLEKKTGIKFPQKIIDKLQNISYEKYVIQAVHKMLSDLSQKYDLELMTLGQEKMQMKKITDTRLGKYFEVKKITITTQPKEKVLSVNKLQKPIYFINDKISETENIAKLFPDINYIIVGRNKITHFPVVENILDLKNLL